MPKISIIVPVYNVETFLRQCLDSLLAQTFTDYELICINDGSTDSSLAILEEYAAADSRIRLFSKENEGYGKTMNLGLAQARAPYIGIVESDDFVKKEMFEKLYEAMQTYRADLVKCNFYKYTTEDGENVDYSREYQEEILERVVEPIDYPALYSAHSSIWAALYDKRFLENNSIWFNETPGGSFQDISFQFRVLSSARRMAVIRDALLYYRTDNMMSSVYSPYKIYCICDEIHLIEQYIREQPAERQRRLWPLAMRRKYYDYRWNWRRLSPVFQYAFYEKMTAELKADYKAGAFENILWNTPADQAEFEKMMKDPMAYFLTVADGFRDTRMDMADTRNRELGWIGFLHVVQGADSIVIYGAGKTGRYVAERLTAHGIPKKKLCFAVTDLQGTAETVDGILVHKIDEAVEGQRDRLILVAVKGEKQVLMLNRLRYLGCKNVILADNDIISYLQEAEVQADERGI